MCFDRVILGKVVCKIAITLIPIKFEIPLRNLVLEPKEMHINRFGAFLFNGIVGNANSGAVVATYVRWSLVMTQFFKCCAQ